jgi:iron complex transport system permease protein
VAAPPRPIPRPARVSTTLVWLGLLTFAFFVVYVGWGTKLISPEIVLRELFRGPSNNDDNRANTIIWAIRLPRALGTMCVGGLLATVGCAFQGLLRNPLADPYIVGVSSGAGLGRVVAILLGLETALGGLGGSAAGFLGGILALALVLGFAYRRSGVDVRTLLLAGVVTGSMLSALLSLCLLLGGRDTNEILKSLLGDTATIQWPAVILLAITLAIGFVVLMLQTRALNAFAIGEETAQRLGVNTRRLKPIVLLTGTAMTAVAVGAVGIIGFVGLIAPHVARRLVGTDWRRSMSVSMVAGALLLLASDLIAQRLTPNDLPIGIITALIGSPVLLILLRKEA